MDEQLGVVADDGVRLVGTLARPDAPGPTPAALILNGSGPLDRDSNVKRQRLGVAPAIAAALAARGVASLRIDKRGVGESGGDHVTYRAQLREPVDPWLLGRVADWTAARAGS